MLFFITFDYQWYQPTLQNRTEFPRSKSEQRAYAYTSIVDASDTLFLIVLSSFDILLLISFLLCRFISPAGKLETGQDRAPGQAGSC